MPDDRNTNSEVEPEQVTEPEAEVAPEAAEAEPEAVEAEVEAGAAEPEPEPAAEEPEEKLSDEERRREAKRRYEERRKGRGKGADKAKKSRSKEPAESNRARAVREHAEAKNKKSKPVTRNADRRNVWLLILTTLLIIGSLIMFMPPNEKINQGLDIQGGLSVVLSAQSTSDEEVSTEDMEKSRAIIESRVNALGASEATVAVQGNNQILVQIPGLSDPEVALQTIGKTGKLEFARADSFTNEEDRTAIENGTYAQSSTVSDDYGNVFNTGHTTYRHVESGTYTPMITGDNITRVTVDRASETGTDYAVNLQLDGDGTAAFAEATKELAPTHGQIVIILDNEIQSAPAVQSEIPGGNVSITGNYTMTEAQGLQTVLESGSLPISFHYEQSQVVGPTLGQDALTGGVLVALIGLLLVMVYLLVFYRGLGLLTAAAMAVFAAFYLGLLATLSAFGLFSLSLAGVAGIVLTIGMAADSSILVLERFREEIRMGRSVRAASITGVRHAIMTSIDADLVTLVSALALFFIATASVKGFGLTLALGIVCDIVMMLILKAPLVRLLAPRVIANNPGFWGIKDSQIAAAAYQELADAEGLPVATAQTGESMNKSISAEYAARIGERAQKAQEAISNLKGRFIRHDINFVGARKILLTISACLVVGSFLVVGLKGVTFGIEFVGGTAITYHNVSSDVDLDTMRDAVTDAGAPDAVIQTTESNGEIGYLVRISTTDAEEAAGIATSVADTIGASTENYQVDTIGPDWGASVVQSSIIAFLVSLLLIILYIAFRFEYKMGVMAIVALLHDLIIVVGVYALFGREITPNMVAALLTILGYSLYDTVVVFHRIADNMQEATVKCSFFTMANHSVNQVFLRTINTTLTSLVPVLCMLLFGSETLKDFAFAMVVGLVAGSYSSIAVATPLFSMWKGREKEYTKLNRKYGPEVGLFAFPPSSIPGVQSSMAAVAAGVESGMELSEIPEKIEKRSKQKKAAAKPQQQYRYRRKKKDE